MPKDPLNNVRNAGGLRVPTAGAAAGPADEISSGITIDDDGVLQRLSNNGTAVRDVLGDGRTRVPVFASLPTTPAAGDFYIQTVDGEEQFFFVDSGNTPIQLVPLTTVTPTVVPLVDGVATNLATVLIDEVGSIEWSVTYYNPTSGARTGYRMWGVHDGTTGADAAATDLNIVTTATLGAITVTTTLDLSGVGAAQEMQLNTLMTGAGWYAAVVAERIYSV